MAENTAISWAQHTFNPWWGCKQVSPACRFCYAKAWDKRYGGNHWGATTERRTFSDKHWREPLKWNRAAAKTGQQVRVFCASMADVFEDHPALPEQRARLWDLIADTPALTWMLLTKRPENVAGMVPWGTSWPGNVWLGVSAETQKFADQRIPILLAQSAAVKFVSAAPLLGPVNLDPPYCDVHGRSEVVTDADGRERCRFCADDGFTGELSYGHWLDPLNGGIDWVITEGESGAKARPSHPDWFRSLRDQCEEAGVAFHHKQNGEFSPNMPKVRDLSRPDGWAPDWDRKPTAWVCQKTGKAVRREADVPSVGSWQAMWKVGLKASGRLLDGELHDAYPATLTAVA